MYFEKRVDKAGIDVGKEVERVVSELDSVSLSLFVFSFSDAVP